MPSKTKDDLLIFDEDSPLFAKKKPASKPRKRGPKSKVEKEEEVIVAENKRIARKRKTKETKRSKQKRDIPKVTSPDDCKKLKPAFKKLLNEKWKLLTTGTVPQAEEVGGWISGAARVIEYSRPEEFDELTVLSRIARKIARERNE